MAEEHRAAPDRRELILAGARKAFLRFGYQRTSLSDIAANAGMSRTALYHYFPGKEEVLRAVVDELHASTLAEAARALAEADSLAAALKGLFAAKFGRLFGSMTESPHGIELVDATHRLTGPATLAADAAFQALVVEALRKFGRGANAEAVADTLVPAAKGLMLSGDSHVSKAAFEARLERLLTWVEK